MTNYNEQAENFLKKTQTTFKAEFLENKKYFEDDEAARDVYIVTLTRGSRVYKFNFGQSLNKSKYFLFEQNKNNTNLLKEITPTAYDVLACLQKYEVGSFENFCSDFGYNIDSIKAKKIYQAVVKEFNEVQKLWTDQEIIELQEIQ